MFWSGRDPLGQLRGKPRKGGVEHVPAGDNDIVVSGLHCKRRIQSYRLFQAAAHAVALDGIAMLLGNGKTDPGLGVGLLAVENLEEEHAALALFAGANGKKLRPAFQPPDSLFLFSVSHSPGLGQTRPLGRETLATASAASNENLAAALGGHTRTETVAALANKLGRLKGTLRHLFNTAVCGPS